MAGFVLPAFSVFQWQIQAPLRGNWNRKPAEGDRLLNAEIDWLVGTTNTALRFDVGGNSPVAMSQIVSLFADNRRCGGDVAFIFPDTGFELVVPAHNQVLSPVLTNALSFYANAPAAAVGDVTILQVCNSMLPPISINPSTQAQSTAAPAINLALPAGSPVQAVPLGVSGTVTGISMVGSATAGAAAGNAQVSIVDGTGKIITNNYFSAPANTQVPIDVQQNGLSVRFQNGLSLNWSSGAALNNAAPNQLTVMIYYTTP